MTYEEAKKIQFQMVSQNDHRVEFADGSGRLGFCNMTQEPGKLRRVYRIDSTWYETREDFLKALQNFEPTP